MLYLNSSLVSFLYVLISEKIVNIQHSAVITRNEMMITPISIL